MEVELKDQNWLRTHGEAYRPPTVVIDLLSRDDTHDISYRHDMCPMFQRVTPEGWIAIIGFHDPDNHEECQHGVIPCEWRRYFITLSQDKEEPLDGPCYSTDDEDCAVIAFLHDEPTKEFVI